MTLFDYFEDGVRAKGFFALSMYCSILVYSCSLNLILWLGGGVVFFMITGSHPILSCVVIEVGVGL